MEILYDIKNLLKHKMKSCGKDRHGRVQYVLPWVAKRDGPDLRSSNCRSIQLLGGLAELLMGRIGRCRYAKYPLCMAPGHSTFQCEPH